MRHARRPRRAARSRTAPDVGAAVDAMSAEELRAFVRDALDQLDDEPCAALTDLLLARSVRGESGWRPASPARETVDEVERFAREARRRGYAAPDEVDEHLRRATQAFLAGDPSTARAIFEALLLPIAEVEVDLGQDELVDEVLTVSVQDCAAQYVAAVYATTPVRGRAEALCRALQAVGSIAMFWEPLSEMERVATGALPELDAFLPLWLARVEREPAPRSGWDNDRDRWLREVAQRLEGVSGLERIARGSRKPQALSAWCSALALRAEWAAALRAYDDAAEIVGSGEPHWCGAFLDGAALAARELGRRDAARRLEAAWLGAPSLTRLSRWLAAAGPSMAKLRKRAAQAIERCPEQAARQLGLLHLLAGNARAAAGLLARAPGLGWSGEDHPGHLLFPALARLLADGRETSLDGELFAWLEESVDALDVDLDDDGGAPARPKLHTPLVVELIEPALRRAADAEDRGAVLDALRAAASKRVEGILGNKRRRHYGHAATLVARCVEVAPLVGAPQVVSDWVARLRAEYSRFPAFRSELNAALASVAT